MKPLFLKFVYLTALVFIPLFASAGTEHNMSGYAWSSNIGWISFNCTNNNRCDLYTPGPGTQGTHVIPSDTNANWAISLSELTGAIVQMNTGNMSVAEYELVRSFYNYRNASNVRTGEYHSVANGANYGVFKTSDGHLCGNESCSVPGYAWSSNIGWIQFGGFSTNIFPWGAGTHLINAKVNGNNLQGWARALSYGGGWDGWISLAGPGYGVNLSGSNFSGYAWGSTVTGWITFNPSTGNGVVTTAVVDPAAFSLGTDENIRIKLLPSGTAETEQKTVTIGFNGAFEAAGNPVTVSLLSSPTVASTTFMYSFDGGANYYEATSGSLTKTIPKGASPYYTENVALKVRIIRLSDAPSLTSPAAQIVLRGTTAGGLFDEKTFTIVPVAFDPRYTEF